MTRSVRRFSVNMTDVDLVQVNYARFFLWMDDGYNALLRELGHPLSRILASGFATPVVDARCEYLRPVGLDDAIELHSAVLSVGRSSYVIGHRFEHDSTVFAVGRCTHVWIGMAGEHTATKAPDWLVGAVEPDLLEDLVTRS